MAYASAQINTLIATAPSGNRLAASTVLLARLPIPVLIYILCVVFPVSMRVGPVMLTSLRLFLMLMIVPLIIRLLMGRFGRIIVTDILFLLHFLWAVVALAVNNPSQVIEQAGSVGIEFIGGYVLARAYIRSPEDFRGLCWLLVWIIIFIFPFAIIETLTAKPLILMFLDRIPVLGTTTIFGYDERLGLDRVQATFAHPIHFGLFCAIALSLCFVGLKGAMSTSARILCSAVILAAGFLGLSSGALSALALQVGLFIWAAMFKRVAWRWWLLASLVVLAYVVVDLLSNRTPLRVFMHYMTFSAHTGYWRIAIFDWGMINVWDNPIFGIGLNDWIRPEWMHSSSVDNFWLLMAMRYGIPGFVFLALGYLIGLIRLIWCDLQHDQQLLMLRQAWVFTFLGLSFVLFTVHVWGNMYSFVFFMFGAGVWMLDVKPNLESVHSTSISIGDALPRVSMDRSLDKFPTQRPADERQSVKFTRFHDQDP